MLVEINSYKDKKWESFDDLVAEDASILLPLENRSTFGPLFWMWIFRDVPPLKESPSSPVAQEDEKHEIENEVLEWPSREAAKDWTARLLSTAHGYARFAQMTSAESSSIWGDEPAHPNSLNEFNVSIIEQVISLEDLKAKGDALDFSVLQSERERKWANTLLEAVRAHTEGQRRNNKPYRITGMSNII